MGRMIVKDLKILVVDDNVHFRTLLRTMLEALGVRWIEEAADGAGALAMLRRFPADLAIMDWRMDHLDGLECVRRIRRDPGSADRFLPVLMVSGFADAELAHEALDSGVDEFLAKPISARSLVATIEKVLEDRRPFVEIEGGYFGPDRRRRDLALPDGDNRRRMPPRLVARPDHQGDGI